MSYIYSKFESKKVYPDPEGTMSRYKIMCSNKEYDFKSNGFLMLYLTLDKFVIRSFYDPNIFKIKSYGDIYLEIPFSSIIKISCCDKDFSQIISLSDYLLPEGEKSKISIEFTKDDNSIQKLDFSINCYVSLAKNAKACQELIDIYNKTVFSEEELYQRSQDRHLISQRIYLRCPIWNIDGIFLFRAFKDRLEFKPQYSDFNEILVPLNDIISFTHEQNFEGIGGRLRQDNYLKLIYKDGFDGQITMFIKFSLIFNAYSREYINFITKLTDMGIIKS